LDAVVTCEYRFFRTPDGSVWTSSAFQYEFWNRYLEVFDRLSVVARIQDVEAADSTWSLSSGASVDFIALPYYVGLVGLLKNLLTIRKVVQKACSEEKAVIFRVPSQSVMLATFGQSKIKQYGLEVVGDPYQVFSAGVTHSALDKILAKLSKIGLQSLAKSANAACYVTNEYLQNRYPVNQSQGAISVGCSDIELNHADFVLQPRIYEEAAKNIVFVGSFSQMYKGPDILIHAVNTLRKQDRRFHVKMLGGGIYLEEMRKLANSLGLETSIEFIGEVNHSEVIGHLDNADMFVMPSRTEGLPRALIEAMARGLPCLATNVGGIPELLEDGYLFDSENISQFADKIDWLSQDVKLLNQASRKNLSVAREYEHEKLKLKRKEFYQNFKQTLEEQRQ